MRKAVETRYGQPASAELDDLQSHAAAHRLDLLGHIDHAAAAFANLLQELVVADHLADGFVGRVGKVALDRGPGGLGLGGQQRLRLLVRRQHRPDTGTQGCIAAAFAVEKRGALGGWFCQRQLEKKFFAVRVHGKTIMQVAPQL